MLSVVRIQQKEYLILCTLRRGVAITSIWLTTPMQLEKYYTCYIERDGIYLTTPLGYRPVSVQCLNSTKDNTICFWMQWCRDLASGIDRLPDRTEIYFRFPYFLDNIHIYVCGQNFELYFSDRLTFSSIRGKTSRQIYRLALPLVSPEMLSVSIIQGFYYIMHTLLYLSGWMTQLLTQMHQ